MSTPEHHNVQINKLQHNPFFITTVAVVIGALMFMVSFTVYYRSDTRETIARLQANNQQIIHDSTDRAATLEDPTATKLEELEASIKTQISRHSDEADYGIDQLTDSALGL